MKAETLVPYLRFLKADLALLETVFTPRNIKMILKQDLYGLVWWPQRIYSHTTSAQVIAQLNRYVLIEHLSVYGQNIQIFHLGRLGIFFNPILYLQAVVIH
jgi:hypothetical protein